MRQDEEHREERSAYLRQLPLSRLLTLAAQLVEFEAAGLWPEPDLNPNEQRVLLTLHLLGPAPAGVTAGLSGLRASTLSNIVARLGAAGLVQDADRGESTDGRVRGLALSAAGVDRAAQLLQRARELDRRLTAGSEDGGVLHQVLVRVLDAQFDRLAGDPRFPDG